MRHKYIQSLRRGAGPGDFRTPAVEAEAVQNEVKTTEGEATAAVKKEADWDAREDEGVVTPPYLGENDDVEQPWQDLQGHAGERAPVTPDFLLEFDEDTEGTTTSGAVVA